MCILVLGSSPFSRKKAVLRDGPGTILVSVSCPGEKSSAENKCRDAWSSGGLPVAVPEDRNDKSGTAMRSGTCVKAETEE